MSDNHNKRVLIAAGTKAYNKFLQDLEEFIENEYSFTQEVNDMNNEASKNPPDENEELSKAMIRLFNLYMEKKKNRPYDDDSI